MQFSSYLANRLYTVYYIDIQFCAVNPSLLPVSLRMIDGWRLRIVTCNLKEPSTVAASVFLFVGFKCKPTLALKL